MERGVKPIIRRSVLPAAKKRRRAARAGRHRVLQPVEALECRRLLAADLAMVTPLNTSNQGEGFETGDFHSLPWDHSGHADWTVTSSQQHNGTYSAKAGNVGGFQTSTLEVTLTTSESGNISFWRKVSSERNFDHFTFFIDGTRQGQWSGDVSWGQVSYDVPAGTHTFSWAYSKDGSVSAGADTAWLDDVRFPSVGDPAPSVSRITPAPGSNIASGPLDVNVTFSESVVGVDASDLELSGSAASGAVVGTPTHQGSNTWRFPVTGIGNGTLNASLAPDAGDIEDASGQDLAPQTWSYTASTNTFLGEDFETGNFSRFPWTLSGDADWTITSDQQQSGTYSARAGDLNHSQSSELEVTLTTTSAGDVSFWRKVSSERNFDYLRFYIDGARQGQWSGEVPWEPISYVVPPGNHTFRWEYAKDSSVSRGADTAWVDDIEFPPVGDPPSEDPPSEDPPAQDPAPSVSRIDPVPGSRISSGGLNVDVTFSESVVGVDASDLELSGSAASGAVVGTATHQGSNTWQFPVTGIGDGTLNVRLAPDAGDIEDSSGQDVAPQTWSYTASTNTFLGEDFETGNFSRFPWTLSGSADWTITSDQQQSGTYSARAGDLNHSQSSELEVTLTTTSAGDVSFWRKVSSERNFDYLRFYIDGARQGQWSGEVPWEQISYVVPPGNHTFRWEYAKDSSVSRGADTAWVDDIEFPPVEDPPSEDPPSEDPPSEDPPSEDPPAQDPVPSVSRIDPTPGSSISSGALNVDVTFSESVVGVDASDLELSGSAASGAVVGTATHQGSNTWRFPVTGIGDGTLNANLAPDAGDIEDASGQDVAPQTWSYTASTSTFLGEDFETGNFNRFPWTISGDADWTITSDQQQNGTFSARAGDVSHFQSSTLEVTLTVAVAGDISFWRKVSSENRFDYLRFYIDGAQQGQWSGEVPWEEVSFPVSSGQHTFSWEYSKDGSTSSGADTGWLDRIQFPQIGDPAPTVVRIDPAPDSTVPSGPLNVDVTFSEAAQGVDASDLELSGVAARTATVGTPTRQSENTWRFPVSGLADGVLNLSLAPHARDIQDAQGQDLAHELWSYSVTSFDGEDFETGDFSQFRWVRSGANWTATSADPLNGQYSAQAGPIGHGQNATLEVAMATTSGGQISFWRKVSSESNFDHFRFYIDDVVQGQWSGEVPWGQETYPVSPGAHRFTWEYAKDGTITRGMDTAWLDDVFFQIGPDTTAPTVIEVSPPADSQIHSSSHPVDIHFSEPVDDVDASDLELSGSAAATAIVTTPRDVGDDVWRFQIGGLGDGDLHLRLARDTGDIVDPSGNVLASETWSYTVTIRQGQLVANYTDDANEGFFDPVLGPDRRQAFEHALSIWEDVLGSAYEGQTIVVDASMDSLGGSTSSAVLGSAGPPTIHRNYSGMVPDRWYGAALANQIAGFDIFDLAEIEAQFNSDVDGAVLGGQDWYYGLDAQPGDDFDFVTVALHEVGHGLNFFDLLDADGTWFHSTTGIYDSFLETGSGVRVFDMASATSRADALVSDDLWWGGTEGVQGNGATRPKIFAPDPYRSGSSTSHLDETAHRTLLMSPRYSSANHEVSDIELGMMLDMGWVLSTGPSPVVSPRPVGGHVGEPESLQIDRRFSIEYHLPPREGGSADGSPAVDLQNIAGFESAPTATNPLGKVVPSMASEPQAVGRGAKHDRPLASQGAVAPAARAAPLAAIARIKSVASTHAEEHIDAALEEPWQDTWDALALDVATAKVRTGGPGFETGP